MADAITPKGRFAAAPLRIDEDDLFEAESEAFVDATSQLKEASSIGGLDRERMMCQLSCWLAMTMRGLRLAAFDRDRLERWVRARTAPQRTALRSRIVLMLSEGLSAREVARRLAVSRHTVGLWRKRYMEEGYPALLTDRPGRGRRRVNRITADN